MSDFLKKIKGVFVVEDQSTASKNKEVKSNSSTKKTTKTSPAKLRTREGGEVSEKFMNVLLKAMEAHNQDGFDYLEFKAALSNLESMQMTEATKYKSAFAMAKTMGVSTEKLIESAAHYLNVLKEEDKKFQEVLVNQRAKQIGNRQTEITELSNLVKEKKAQIAKLQRDIDTHVKTIEKRKKEIDASTTKVELTNSDFQVTYKSIVGQIEKDVSHIKQYLK